MSTWRTVQPVSSGSLSPVRRGAAYWRRLTAHPGGGAHSGARAGGGAHLARATRLGGEATHTGVRGGPQDCWAMACRPAPREPSASA